MPPKPKSDQQRQQMRAAIIDAARELFVSRGIEAVTMREIARCVGYSPTALYLHFKDKQALLRELCDTDFLALAKELKEIGLINDPMERLRLLGLGYVRFAMEYPNHYQLMFMTPQLQKDLDSSSIEAGNPEQDAYAHLLLTVEDAHAAGNFRIELGDPDLIAQTLWAGLHGLCALEIAKRNDPFVAWRNFEDRSSLMLQALMRGLLKEI